MYQVVFRLSQSEYFPATEVSSTRIENFITRKSTENKENSLVINVNKCCATKKITEARLDNLIDYFSKAKDNNMVCIHCTFITKFIYV